MNNRQPIRSYPSAPEVDEPAPSPLAERDGLLAHHWHDDEEIAPYRGKRRYVSWEDYDSDAAGVPIDGEI